MTPDEIKHQQMLAALNEDDDAPYIPSMLDQQRAEDLSADDEGITRPMDAPLTPPSRVNARKYLKSNPNAAIDVMFPTVYEEDRSAKLRDLGTAETLNSISHQRSSEQMAKELGFDEYDYDEEMAAIKKEMAAGTPFSGPPEPQLGSGDASAGRLMDLFGKSPARPSAKPGIPSWVDAPAIPSQVAPLPADSQPKRADLASPEQAEFRRQQKQSEAIRGIVEAQTASMRKMLDALRSIRQESKDERVARDVRHLEEKIEKLGTVRPDAETTAAIRRLSESVDELRRTPAPVLPAPVLDTTPLVQAIARLGDVTDQIKLSPLVTMHALTDLEKSLAKVQTLLNEVSSAGPEQTAQLNERIEAINRSLNQSVETVRQEIPPAPDLRPFSQALDTLTEAVAGLRSNVESTKTSTRESVEALQAKLAKTGKSVEELRERVIDSTKPVNVVRQVVRDETTGLITKIIESHPDGSNRTVKLVERDASGQATRIVEGEIETDEEEG